MTTNEWHGPIVTVNLCPHCGNEIAAQFEARVVEHTDWKFRCEKAEGDNARLRKALEVYADPDNWRWDGEQWEGSGISGMDTARAALKEADGAPR